MSRKLLTEQFQSNSVSKWGLVQSICGERLEVFFQDKVYCVTRISHVNSCG